MSNKKIESGNIKTNEGNGKDGWFFGCLDNHTVPYPWHYEKMQMKWYKAKENELKSGEAKTDERNITITILIEGKHEVFFPDEEKDRYRTMEEPGDYVSFRSGIKHTWKAGNGGSTTLTLRFPDESSGHASKPQYSS